MRESERRWRDGSLEEDLPMRCLSEMFNVNYFLVSQTNPHIVPALNMKKRLHRKLGNFMEAEWKHRCGRDHLATPSHSGGRIPQELLVQRAAPLLG